MDCPPPLVSMETVALPNEDGSLTVVSNATTDTRQVTAGYDLRLNQTQAAVAGEVDLTNRRPAQSATIRYRWSRAIDDRLRPAIQEGSSVCYDPEQSLLVVQLEATVEAGETVSLPLEWSVRLHPAEDINLDGVVDGADQGLLFADWGSDNFRSDLNRDGVVNGADLGLLSAKRGWSAPWLEPTP